MGLVVTELEARLAARRQVATRWESALEAFRPDQVGSHSHGLVVGNANAVRNEIAWLACLIEDLTGGVRREAL